jgi:putative ABC transport system permease protein
MNLINSAKLSILNLSVNKVRTLLTTSGIIIGIASVIVVMSAGEGIKSLILGQLDTFGTDIIETEIKVPNTAKNKTQSQQESGIAMVQGVQVTTLKLKDMEDINKLPNIKGSYSGILGQEATSYQGKLKKVFLYGVTASYDEIDRGEIAEGRFFSESEDKGLAQVVVLGSELKQDLFGESDVLGKEIKIKKKNFQVVGVMKKRGSIAFFNFDDLAYVPVRTLQKKILGVEHLVHIISQFENKYQAEYTAEQIRRLVRENHDITDPDKDDFVVTTMAEAMEVLATVTGAITLLLLALVGVSLIVGGVGIMNVMYVAVTERTREIGLRKTVGANYADVMRQFVIESVLLTIIGGIIGILLGIFISFLLYRFAITHGMPSWRFIITLKSIIIALGFSAFFGIFFGVMPARRAARLDPIQALRT